MFMTIVCILPFRRLYYCIMGADFRTFEIGSILCFGEIADRSAETAVEERDEMKKIFLVAGAVGWGISLLGVVLPWKYMNMILQNMGSAVPVSDPQLQYWFRMATGSWSIVGFFFFMVLLKPEKYGNLIPLLAVVSIFEGVILLIHGLMLNLTLFPFAGDVAFCLIVGSGLIINGEK